MPVISTIISAIIFLTGLAVGSFLNCVIYRLEIGGSFLKGRSFCPFCKHKLFWFDLIPVFSFLFLRAKCRYCKKPISVQYPLVELATGILFVLLWNYELGIMNYKFLSFEFIIYFLFLILISSFLILIFVFDLKHYIIPDKVVLPAIIIIFIYNLQFLIFKNFSTFNRLILSGFGAAGFFLLIFLLSKGRAMGGGDVKLGFLMGFLLGFPDILPALFFTFLIGAIIGIGLILTKKKKLKSEVPFGPFLVLGTYIAIFWGQALVNWYLSLFGL